MKDRLVAHRGDMTTYPENTLTAIKAALDLGMQWIEIDVQMSKNQVPMVIHDSDLLRVAGVPEKITKMTDEALTSVVLNFPKKDVANSHIPTLAEVVELMNHYPHATLFVEVKKESVAVFGLQDVMTAVHAVLNNAKFPIVFISFLYDAVVIAKTAYKLPVGWVVTYASEETKQRIDDLQPDFVFCDVKKIHKVPESWKNKWRWVLYDVMEPELAQLFMQHDNMMIETGDIVGMMESSILS